MKTTEDDYVVLNKNGSISIRDDSGKELESFDMVSRFTSSRKDDGDSIKVDEILATWDLYNIPIISEKGVRVIEFRDMIPGITIKKEVDQESPVSRAWWLSSIKKIFILRSLSKTAKKKEILASYSIPAGAHLSVKEKEKVSAGSSSWPRLLVKLRRPRTLRVVCRGWLNSFEARRNRKTLRPRLLR